MTPAVRPALRAALAALCASAALLTATAPVAAADPPRRSAVEVEIPGPEHGGEAGSGHVRVPAAGPAKAAPASRGPPGRPTARSPR